MITLCSVITSIHECYLKIFLKSIEKLKLVSKVLIASTNPNPGKKWKSKNIDFEIFEVPVASNEFGHALGLHACIDRTETDYILFSDPDLFFYSAVDELYFSLKEKYNLNYVGCSHHSALSNAYAFFPYLVNSLVKKSDLPGPDFLKGYLKFKPGLILQEQTSDESNHTDATGKYLIGGPIPEFISELPNVKPSVLFDTGINLCLWGIRNKWRWLSFQTQDCHFYNSKYFRGNVKIQDKIPLQNLIWHSVRDNIAKMEAVYYD